MAMQSHDWEVERVGNNEDVKLELRDGQPHVMRVTLEDETVELHVDDDGIAEAVNVDIVPEWVKNVAARLGVYEVR